MPPSTAPTTPLLAVRRPPPEESWTTRGRAAAWIGHVSLWSYSMYLVNLPLRNVMMHALGDVEAYGLAARLLGGAVWCAGTVLISAWLYRGYERPMTGLRERFAIDSRSPDRLGAASDAPSDPR